MHLKIYSRYTLYSDQIIILYEAGRKYCRRCKVYYCHNGVFCPCCGMALRVSPIARKTRKKKPKSTLVT